MLLSGRAIRWIGRVSYGAYLFHWPVYLWLSPERTSLEQWPLFGLRVLVTFALAGISYNFLEAPIRRGRVLRGWQPFVATPAAFIVVVAAASAVTEGPARSARLNEANEQFAVKLAQALNEGMENPPPSRDQTAPRVAIYGDSTALQLSLGFDNWSRKQAGWRARPGVTELGCGLMREGAYRFRGLVINRPRHCQDRDKSWADNVELFHPDIAVVFFGPWEVADRKLPGEVTPRAPGDPILDAYIREEMLAVVDILSAHGTLVVWLTHPVLQTRDRRTGKLPETPFPESDPARMERFNELIFGLEDLRPGNVRAVDLAGYMRTLPGGELDEEYRPDGIHLTADASAKLAGDWLASEILRVYLDNAPRRGLPIGGQSPDAVDREP
jgi:hypothetical protein